MLKQIWQDREVVIIEGSQSRTGVGNDLYDNARTIERILGFPKDGFAHYYEMLQAVREHVRPEEGKLLLLSYGPTATILAYDLAKLGYQAVDIGHLDIEYEYFRNKNHEGGIIKGKYTNEAEGGDVVDECRDAQYLSQIICDITK
jgi:glycosyltransferase family protein